ncbi:DUF401 family protein [Clostridium formicaceticum]|uniref:DUF401 family protein n=1 Tax=Clostridium formicaceticum TaxID=1497 RepID=A0AAC9RND5_9CLOT|nr:DUF401 family protein [Clostridium formicaceticum]AOY77777.1 hypothetical protein BJL90_19075 [Clostridium formicaceticum]ARE88383.1 hypothetical protein CLFO_27850 [Clostridium formicaceticum]
MLVFSLGVSLGVILFLVNRKINMGYSMIVAAALLALLNGRSIPYIVNTFLHTIVSQSTITLALTVGLITVLAYLMDQYLILDRMVVSLETILRSAKLTILLAPSIMGTLLVYGGALMSCPVVGRLGDRLSISKDEKATINLLFRHTLFLIFPLSPAMILAIELGEIAAWDLIKIQFPISVFMYILGYILFIRNYKDPEIKKVNTQEYLKAIMQFLLYALPILISLLGALIFSMPFYISLLLGIGISMAINTYDKRYDTKYDMGENPLKTMYKGLKMPLVIAIIGIMFYRNIVTDMDEIYVFFGNLLEQGMPLELLIFMACAVICLSLASAQPGIAILFPIVLPLAPDYDTKLLYAMFIFTTSFLFYYISPLHLCQVLTLEYFEVGLRKLYKNYVYLIPLTFLSMVAIYVVNIF